MGISFIVTLYASSFFFTTVTDHLILNRKIVFCLIGGFVVFGIGFFDDIKRLGPLIKVIFQIAGVSIAYWGGIRINGICLFDNELFFGPLSYFITLFWFLLFINSVNLMDGLDGLSTGIVFFVSVVMTIILVISSNYLIAMMFAALAGSTLGFLKYNFNPASIFMGDSGSYFLGYTLASLAILGSIKSQLGAVMLIPVVAMGVPLIDTILAPIRRFVLGKKMFEADRGHIHHRLLEMGLSTQKSVLIIYAISICLCISTIILVNLRNETIGFFFIMLGIGAFILIRKLGYFEYFAVDKVMSWFKDVGDDIGINHERRSFLNYQIKITNSKNIKDLWDNTCTALEKLTFDMAELHFDESTGLNTDLSSPGMSWLKDGFTNLNFKKNFLKIELPLLGKENMHQGTLYLYKDLKTGSMNDYTLRRVELLRKTMIQCIEKMIAEKQKGQEAGN